jgi:hypothetical protein
LKVKKRRKKRKGKRWRKKKSKRVSRTPSAWRQGSPLTM